MNKQIMGRLGLVTLLFLVAGVASWLLIAPNAEETKAWVVVSGRASEFDLFKSYATWPNSSVKKVGTAAEWLHTMAPPITSQPTTSVDVNGDGLTDVLVHQENRDVGGIQYYGVLLNRGDLKFDLAYKCVVDSDLNKFYGDCAQ